MIYIAYKVNKNIMNNPIKMHDTVLSTNVDLYQIGLPDPFGANALIYYDGSKNDYTGEMSVLNGNPMWMTVNIKRLEPISWY